MVEALIFLGIIGGTFFVLWFAKKQGFTLKGGG